MSKPFASFAALVVVLGSAAVAQAELGHTLRVSCPYSGKVVNPPDSTPTLVTSSAGPFPDLAGSTYSGTTSADTTTGFFHGETQATVVQSSGVVIANNFVSTAFLREALQVKSTTTVRAKLKFSSTGHLSSNDGLIRISATLRLGGNCQAYVSQDFAQTVATPPAFVSSCPYATYADESLVIELPISTQQFLEVDLRADFGSVTNYQGSIASTFDGRLDVQAVSGGPLSAGTSTFLSAVDGGAPTSDGGAAPADATVPLDATTPIDGGAPPSDPGAADPKCSFEPGAVTAGAGGWSFVALLALARARRSRRR